jgi:hypothetical protein
LEKPAAIRVVHLSILPALLQERRSGRALYSRPHGKGAKKLPRGGARLTLPPPLPNRRTNSGRPQRRPFSIQIIEE